MDTSCFHLWAIVSNAAVKVHVQIFLFLISVLLGIREIPGSHGNSIFHFWRKLYTVIHSDYTILHSHQQCTRVPISPYPLQHLLFFVFALVLIVAVLVDVRWAQFYFFNHKSNIYVFFFRFFSLLGYYKILNTVPCAIQ